MMPWDVCRLCLAGNTKLYSITNAQLLDVYAKITSNEWNRDRRPDTLCYICLSQLKTCSRLSEMSKRSEEIFAQFFAGGFEFTEETIPILNKRKLHKFVVAPVQAFTVGFTSNEFNQEDLTIKFEHDPEIIFEDDASETKYFIKLNTHNKEVINNRSGPCSHEDVTEKVTIQHSTPNGVIKHNSSNITISHEEIMEKDIPENNAHKKDTIKHSDHKRDTEKQTPQEKDMLKNSLNKDVISAIPISPKKEIVTSSNEVSELNTHNYKAQPGLTISSEVKGIEMNKTEDKIKLENSPLLENNRSNICFTLRFNINNNGNTKRRQTPTGKRPFPLVFLDQPPYEKFLKTPYTCVYCHVHFTSKHILENHMKTHKPYYCEFCDASFNQQSLLRLHKISHEKPYSCKQCPNIFHSLKHLNEHYKSHENIKSYTCEVCKKDFTQLSNLQQHMRTHTGDTPYTCDICDKSFKQMSNLLQHNRVHTKEKPYSCHICFKTFGQRSHLDQHRRIHDGKKPYDCDYCDKSFRQKSNLLQHMKTLHIKKP